MVHLWSSCRSYFYDIILYIYDGGWCKLIFKRLLTIKNILKKYNPIIKLFLILCLGIVLLSLYYIINPTDGDFFPECPIHKFTGIYCPGCGSQRTLHFLLHLDLYNALKYNPLIVILSPFLLYISSVMIYNFIFNKQCRVKILYNNTFVIFFFSMILIYTILRNIPCKPFCYLAPSF
ncbi:DUF2752 domain-containing protein [Apibacter sp. HY039]|uniref:DUF2752 domain-containing protein n=1 Tax=Apibacter sp. HY039 TaxID=2501476 RepID=UPI000FEC1194